MQTPPITSRANLSELGRQRTLPALDSSPWPVRASDEDDPPPPDRSEEDSKGQGRKGNVQRDPEDQRSSPDPKDGEGRKAP